MDIKHQRDFGYHMDMKHMKHQMNRWYVIAHVVFLGLLVSMIMNVYQAAKWRDAEKALIECREAAYGLRP